jgi:hypothetical protein
MPVIDFRRADPNLAKRLSDEVAELRDLEMAIGCLVQLGYHGDDPIIPNILKPISDSLEQLTDRLKSIEEEVSSLIKR